MTESCINNIRLLDIVHGTSVDGPGLRTSIYGAGCTHHCPGCHNPQSWDPNGGVVRSIAEVAEEVLAEDLDVTFSGGDPMFQPEAFTQLAKLIRQRSTHDIWCYTGYRIEQLVRDPRRIALLEQVDVLVDGPFVQHLRDLSLLFRGSSNQRLIDVQATLAQQQVVLYAPLDVTYEYIARPRQAVLWRGGRMSRDESGETREGCRRLNVERREWRVERGCPLKFFFQKSDILFAISEKSCNFANSIRV